MSLLSNRNQQLTFSFNVLRMVEAANSGCLSLNRFMMRLRISYIKLNSLCRFFSSSKLFTSYATNIQNLLFLRKQNECFSD